MSYNSSYNYNPPISNYNPRMRYNNSGDNYNNSGDNYNNSGDNYNNSIGVSRCNYESINDCNYYTQTAVIIIIQTNVII